MVTARASRTGATRFRKVLTQPPIAAAVYTVWMPFERGVDGYALSARKPRVESAALPIDKDEIDFRVEDAQRLDGILHRRTSMEGVSEHTLEPLGRQEVVQLFVESKLDRTLTWGVFHTG